MLDWAAWETCLEGEWVSEVALAQFVAAGHYPQVQAELTKRGLV